MPHVVIVTGTRPEIIKMSPIIRELQGKAADFTLVHTGQHYDYELSKVFFEQLQLPRPDYTFKLHNHSPASQIGEIMGILENILRNKTVNTMLIQGDTNSMLASAITGVKLSLKIAHVESGLRSYDWRMPEEHNRRMVDHVSDLLFAPTIRAKNNLINEHVQGKIYVTGNTVIDTILDYFDRAQKMSKILDKIQFDEFALVTIHRSENVDNVKVLKEFVECFVSSPIPLVIPIHPRTANKLRQFNLLGKLKSSRNVQLLHPVGYMDALVLMSKCRLIMTDSGGIIEEATCPRIRKPVLILRSSTERPEAIERGFARLAGTHKQGILQAVHETLNNPPRLPVKSPYGDGKAAERIVKHITFAEEMLTEEYATT